MTGRDTEGGNLTGRDTEGGSMTGRNADTFYNAKILPRWDNIE